MYIDIWIRYRYRCRYIDISEGRACAQKEYSLDLQRADFSLIGQPH